MKPILVLQQQRLGDILLTFPLLMELQRRFPDSPVWMVAEPQFFQGLFPFSPNVTFFPSSHLNVLARESYTAIFNLGTNPLGAKCAAKARADIKYGPLATEAGVHILGFWQLYRAALTQNNRHNAFHWADLNRLDAGLPLHGVLRSEPQKKGKGRIGLFVGASDKAKRPEPLFWGQLARHLSQTGFMPLFLGGPAEKELGEEAAKYARLPRANFCGKTNLAALAEIISGLDLFITPDTGPMHLADWLGTPVLNLSMGNVQAHETGPVSPGQWIVRAHTSCSGCWQCSRSGLVCKNAFKPKAIATTATDIIEAKGPLSISSGLEIFRTYRDELGLHQLSRPGMKAKPLRGLLEDFWQSVFIDLFTSRHGIKIETSVKTLASAFPKVTEDMRKNFGKMLAIISSSLRKSQILPSDFWQAQPWHSRLFAGYAQMRLQNENFSKNEIMNILDKFAYLESFFKNLI